MPTYDTPDSQTDWTVPQGVIAVDIRVVGGSGGGGSGGPGGEVTGRIPVTAGEVLSIIVGESGGQPAPGQSPLGDGGEGGSPSGSGSYGGGGGAPSGVIRNGTELAIGAGGGGAASFEGAYTSNGGGGGGARGGLGGSASDGSAGADAAGTGVGGDGGSGNGGSGEAGGTAVDAVVEDVTTGASTDAPRVELTPIIPAPTIDGLDASTPREVTITYSVDVAGGDVLVERSTDGGTTWTEAGTITDLSATTWTDTGLLDGKRYTYRLTLQAAGTTAQSGTQSATTIPPAPSTPTLDSKTATSADVSWTNNDTAGNAQRRVYVRRTGVDGDASYRRTGMVFETGEYAEMADLEEFDELSASIAISPAIDLDGEGGNWFGNADGNEGWMFYRSGVYAGSDSSGDWLVSGLGFGNIPTGEVSHLTFTFGPNGARTYKNGSLSSSSSVTGTIDSTSIPLVFGYHPSSSWTPPNGFAGSAYSLQLHRRELSQSEVAEIHNEQVVTDGLVGYWPLDLIQNGTTPDLSPYANDGTVNGPTLTGPTVQDKSGLLSNSTESYTIQNLLNGEEYEAFVHTVTDDNEVRNL